MDNQYSLIRNLISGVDSVIIEAHSVGALLYTPATNKFIYEKLLSGTLGNKFSLALCLEDSIDDSAVEIGEKNIIDLFSKLYSRYTSLPYLPQLFIRVRDPRQISKLYLALGETAHLLKGFILPKFSLLNAVSYITQIININQLSTTPIYMLPILEAVDIVPLSTRASLLQSIHELLLQNKPYVLNVRVGGNDLCHTFGVRRNANENIYNIRPVASILSDIVTTFCKDFVISGPVWEYFADENDNWKTGLEAEMRLDLLNGFIGKTVIHPNQIPIVNNCLRVNQHDLDDAMKILTFENPLLQVVKSSAGTRMNEIKTHTNWAKKQLLLAYIHGVK
ncbi:HpcH/HpaI aldolase/citrate lyase family protein [Aminipila sp.]|uniref:HpcH/HpaI aldolase/citrate lyase family protein n=1 Tax=Aminipila sp. TaxID=2060095 RepID=UPI00289C3666|nr:HpcH/HpaI aldolase/citrate lyase family protein [Aminipila sp.]